MTRRSKKSQQQEYSSEDAPSEGVKHGLRPVSPPMQTTRLSRLIYILILLTALLGSYYSYRVVQYKQQVGGWWDVALGRRPQADNIPSDHSHHRQTSVEDKINDLAKALGMPSKELASAIAVAVRNYVPPASLSSVAAKETGPAVQALLKEPPSQDQTLSNTPSATNIVGGVFEGVESFVGMDEP
ncbi:hypothetical protein D9756_009145 [Leucocoprinus leucothites]|uniref:Uncharacterized protein n=1 Tax=Leucocoprinus leucothites TaxID=201217 RepID=A0A8H5FVB5_9AGAR|nr:hypothetical protein D9756_009145 [Leucoagaricus leucothites]